ncbi:putative ANTH domain, ENTH domain-containing protein [Helianthus anomalus]
MRNLIGTIKDNLSLSKLTLSKPTTSYLHIAVLRTTTHSPTTPPTDHHLTTLLTLGDSSRATASIIIHSLTTRLHRTKNTYVALKCLFTVHVIITRGPFILKDQLAVFPSANGHNNLKLSNFRDKSSAATWILSAWVRWYARYIETILFTLKNKSLVSSCFTVSKEKQQDLLSSIMTSDLIRDFGLLVSVIDEICKVPDELSVERNRLVYGIMELLAHDYLLTVNELVIRLTEFKVRVKLLSWNELVELGSVIDRLTASKERLLQLFSFKKISVETLWEMVEELDNEIGMGKFQKPGVSQLSLVTEL